MGSRIACIARRIMDSVYFERFSLACILGTAVAVGLETDPGIKVQYGELLLHTETALLWFFVAETGIRFLASGPRFRTFLQDGWNVFDVVIIVICMTSMGGHFAAVIRLARVLRVLRVVRLLPRLRVIVSALMRGVASMGYIAVLLSILFYIFAVLGVFLFRESGPAHFGSLSAAFLTLFQVVTLEGWVDIMREQMASGLNSVAAPLYFISFIVLGTMIVLNLFIGTIVGSMTEAEKDATQATADLEPTLNRACGMSEIAGEIRLLEEQLKLTRERCDNISAMLERAASPAASKELTQ